MSLLFDSLDSDKNHRKNDVGLIRASLLLLSSETKIRQDKIINRIKNDSHLSSANMPRTSASKLSGVATDKVFHQVHEAIENDIDDESVRQYRMSLAKEIRRIRKLSVNNQKIDWQGNVAVTGHISRAQQAIISLSQSSGDQRVDEAAVDMLSVAMSAVTLPEKLWGKQFSLSLDIRFSAD